MPDRVAVYIDGFNLYFGLKSKHWKHLYWLDVGRLAQNLLLPNQVLATSKYFTARISGPPAKQRRQVRYLDALHAIGSCDIQFGKYQNSRTDCRSCGTGLIVPNEKMTDVRIATELLADAFENLYDVALLVSGDSDLVPAIERAKRIQPAKRIVVAFPPNRISIHLRQVADSSFVIGRRKLAKSQLPEIVTTSNGVPLKRPRRWSRPTGN